MVRSSVPLFVTPPILPERWPTLRQEVVSQLALGNPAADYTEEGDYRRRQVFCAPHIAMKDNNVTVAQELALQATDPRQRTLIYGFELLHRTPAKFRRKRMVLMRQQRDGHKWLGVGTIWDDWRTLISRGERQIPVNSKFLVLILDPQYRFDGGYARAEYCGDYNKPSFRFVPPLGYPFAVGSNTHGRRAAMIFRPTTKYSRYSMRVIGPCSTGETVHTNVVFHMRWQ